MWISFFRYIYFLILFLLAYILFLWGNIVEKYNNIVLISYIIVFLPFLDWILEYLKNEIREKTPTVYDHFQKLLWMQSEIIFWVLSLFTLVVYHWNLLKAGTIIFFLFVFIYKISHKVSFFVAFFLLFCIPIFFIRGAKVSAETSIIYAFYFILMGVFFLGVETLRTKNIFEGVSQFPYFKKIKKLFFHFQYILVHQYDRVFFLILALYWVFFVLGFYSYRINMYLSEGFLVVLLFYVFWKFLGFQFCYKKLSWNLNFGNFLVMAVLFLLLSAPIVKSTFSHHKYLLLLASQLLFYAYIAFVWTRFLQVSKHYLEESVFLKSVLSMFILASFSFLILVDVKYTLQAQKIMLENKRLAKLKEKNEKALVMKKTTFKKSDFDTNLYPGSSGEKVKKLQTYLKENGYFNYKIDGNYDERTKYAVNKFLSETCDWDKTNKGTFGPLARDCLISQLKQ